MCMGNDTNVILGLDLASIEEKLQASLAKCTVRFSGPEAFMQPRWPLRETDDFVATNLSVSCSFRRLKLA